MIMPMMAVGILFRIGSVKLFFMFASSTAGEVSGFGFVKAVVPAAVIFFIHVVARNRIIVSPSPAEKSIAITNVIRTAFSLFCCYTTNGKNQRGGGEYFQNKLFHNFLRYHFD